MTFLEDPRVRTFVLGLDELLGGGIPRGHTVLISGPPGSMKSSLAYSILYHNATKHQIPVLYVSLEQTRAGILRQMRAMGFTDPIPPSFGIIDVATIRKERGTAAASRSVWLDFFWRALGTRRRLHPYELLALDSLDALELLAKFPNPRGETLRLFESLRHENLTSFVVTEATRDSWVGGGRGGTHLAASFLADGVISLRMHNVTDVAVQRRMRVVKMRGTAHETRYFAVAFESGHFGIQEALSG